jgi:DNA-binding MarR family transcriptional regulator
MTVPSGDTATDPDRATVEQSILRLFLRKGELEWDDQHPLFDSGLTIPQMKVLFTAARPGGARPGLIAERTRMAPPNVTTVLDRLSDRGLLYRAPDPDDGRATIVLLTEDGKRLVRAVAAASNDRQRSALAQLSDAELAQLQTGLQALVREMRARVQGTP